MTETEHLREEIKELSEQIFRLRGSMNRADNGVKLKRIDILTRTLGRCERALAAIERKQVAA